MATPAQDMADLQKLMRSFIESNSQLLKQQIRTHKATQGVNEALEVYEAEIRKTNKLSDKQTELLRKAMDAKQKELQLIQKSVVQQRTLDDARQKLQAAGANATTDLIDAVARGQALLNATNKNLAYFTEKATKAQQNYSNSLTGIRGAMHSFNRGITNATGGLGGFGGGLNGVLGKLGAFGSILGLVINQAIKGIDMTKKVMVSSGGVFEGVTAAGGLVSQTFEGMTRFIKPEDMAKLASESRLVTNSMGGLHNSMLQFDATAKDLFAQTGDIAEAYRQTAQISLQFATKGIHPAQDALKNYTDDMLTQNKINGMSLEQSRALYDGVAGDISTIKLLKAARVGERQSILDNQRAMILNNQALGMTAEQAGEAAKMLGKMVAEKPLDRLRKAAKIQAYGAAMGLGPEASAAASAIRKGARASAEEKEQARHFFTSAANMQDSMARMGDTQEITSAMLAEKLDMESIVGPESPFSTTLGNIIAKPLEETKAMFAEARGTMVSEAVRMKEMFDNSLEMLRNGSLAMIGIWSAADALTRFLDSNTNIFETAMLRAVDVLLAPFQALSGMVDMVLGGFGKIFELISGFFGMDTLESIFAKSSNKLLSDAQGFFSGIMSHWKDTEETKASTMPKEIQNALNRTINLPSSEVKKTETADIIKENQAKTATIQQADTGTRILEATQQQHTTFNSQLAKLDESSAYLKTIADTQPVLVDLAQKQLAAMTMTETQRQQYAGTLKGTSSKFAAEYATVT